MRTPRDVRDQFAVDARRRSSRAHQSSTRSGERSASSAPRHIGASARLRYRCACRAGVAAPPSSRRLRRTAARTSRRTHRRPGRARRRRHRARRSRRRCRCDAPHTANACVHTSLPAFAPSSVRVIQRRQSRSRRSSSINALAARRRRARAPTPRTRRFAFNLNAKLVVHVRQVFPVERVFVEPFER